MLVFNMMAHIAVHAGIEIEVVEVVMREEVEQFGAGHLFGVSSGLAQDTQDTRTATVLGGRDLLQIVERPVHDVAINMVDFHAFRARSDEGLPHEMMAPSAAKMRHQRITGMYIRFSFKIFWNAWLEFPSFRVVKLAEGATEKDFATYRIRWHLFDNRYNHNASLSLLLAATLRSIGKSGAKVGIKKTSLEFRDSFGNDGNRSVLSVTKR